MKNNIKYILALSVFTLFSFGLFAQDETETEDLDLDVVIIGTAELFLNDANKVTTAPEIKESILELPILTYNLIPRKPTQAVQLKPVPAAKIVMSEKPPNLFRGYAKGAVGTKLTGLGELRFMDGYSRKGTFDSHLKYYTTDGFVSQADSISDSYSMLSLGVSAKRFLKKHSVGIDIDYDREKVHYYGYDPVLYPENYEVDDKRLYRDFDAGIFLKSYFRDSTKLNYFGKFDFIQFSDNVNSSENNFIFNTIMNKYKGYENYALDFDLDFNSLTNVSVLTDGERTFKNTVFTINPTVTTNRNGLMARIGARITGNSLNGALKPHIYPDIEVKANLFDGLFMPYAGIGGELHKNRYRTLAEENPFIQSFIKEDVVDDDVLLNTNEKIRFYGGVRGNISNDMSFNTKISRSSFDDFVYYVSDTLVSQGNRFKVEYGELKRTTVTGELTYNLGDKIKFFGRGDFYVYDDFIGDEEAWNQPVNKITISGSYNIQNKLKASLEVFSLGQRRAKSLGFIEGGELNEDGTFYTYDLKRFVDATLKAEYRYTKRLSVYAQINNFLAAKYVRYNNFPVQRFNFLGGATYSF